MCCLTYSSETLYPVKSNTPSFKSGNPCLLFMFASEATKQKQTTKIHTNPNKVVNVETIIFFNCVLFIYLKYDNMQDIHSKEHIRSKWHSVDFRREFFDFTNGKTKYFLS